MSLLLGEAMRDLNDDLTVVLNSFRDIASMHAWAAESPQTALNELRTRFAIAKNALTQFASATRDADGNVYARLLRFVRDRQRHLQQSSAVSDALSVAISVLTGGTSTPPVALVDRDTIEPSKDALLTLLKSLAGTLDIDVSDSANAIELAIGGKAVMLEVSLVDDAAVHFVQNVQLQFINPRDNSLFCSPEENAALLRLLRAGNRLALSRWFVRLRQYNDWASQFNVDVRKLLAVFEADFVTLARSVNNAEHANSGLGRLATGGPTALSTVYYEPALLEDEQSTATRSLFFVMELVAESTPVALPLTAQVADDAVVDIDSAFSGNEPVGETVNDCRLRYVAHLSQPLAITVRALGALLAQAQVGAEVTAPSGSLPTAMQLVYRQVTTKQAPMASSVFETTVGSRRQRFSVNFGTGDTAVLVQRLPLVHVRDANALIGALRQQHIVHEMLASLFLVATPEVDGVREQADGFELSFLPPDRILVHLSVGDASSTKLAALMICVRRDQRITCELSGINEAAAHPIAEYAERLLGAARSLPHTLARIAPLLGDAVGGDSMSDVAQARLARLAANTTTAAAASSTTAATSQRAKRNNEQISSGTEVQAANNNDETVAKRTRVSTRR